MALKYLTLDGLSYFKQKCDAKYVTSADIQTAVSNAFSSYKQGVVTIVATLPATGEEGYLYLVPDTNASTNDVYTTWTWEEVNGTAQWVQIGATTFTITIDSVLDGTSTNPIENKAVYDGLDLKVDKSDLTASIAQNGTNAVTSGAIYDALALKLNTADLEEIENTEIDNLFV